MSECFWNMIVNIDFLYKLKNRQDQNRQVFKAVMNHYETPTKQELAYTDRIVTADNKPREGDWICLVCQNLNFSFRKKCNRCKVQTRQQNDNHQYLQYYYYSPYYIPQAGNKASFVPLMEQKKNITSGAVPNESLLSTPKSMPFREINPNTQETHFNLNSQKSGSEISTSERTKPNGFFQRDQSQKQFLSINTNTSFPWDKENKSECAYIQDFQGESWKDIALALPETDTASFEQEMGSNEEQVKSVYQQQIERLLENVFI